MTDAVAIIVPVLNRPQNVAPLVESVARATPESHRLLFMVESGDVAELAAIQACDAQFWFVSSEQRSWACKVNAGYRATTEPWIFTGADDLAFRPGWFARALAWADESVAVIGTNDLANPRVMCGQHSTHSLVRRSYVDEWGTVDQPGAVVHEGYGHDWADDELVETARARGVYVHAFDSLVEHLHPMVGKAADDDTYRLGRSASREGKRLLQSRRRLWANLAPLADARRRVATVVTASYGGIDAILHPQVAQDVPVDWVCFTDQPDLVAPAPWRIVVDPARHDDPRMAAAVHKFVPQVESADVVWIDASMEVTSPSFVREALAARRDGVAVWAHPRRRCVYAEAAALEVEAPGKYDMDRVAEQVEAYQREGHPVDAGLYALGTIAWDTTATMLGAAVMAEVAKWATIDQMAFPVVCRRLGVTPGVFPVAQIERGRRGRTYLQNRWLRIHPHRVVPSAVSVSVVVPFTSGCPHREAALRHVLDHYARHHRGWEVVEGSCEGEWSKGRAVADAVGRATGDVLVVADADAVVPVEDLAAAVAEVGSGRAWAVPHRRVFRLSEAHTADVLAGAEPTQQRLARPAYAGVRGGGVVVVSRGAWEASGGIDPRFVGWGGEDLSWGRALETLCGPPVHLTAPLYHLFHPAESMGPGRRGSAESEALAGRYLSANGKPAAMRALVAEHQMVSA